MVSLIEKGLVGNPKSGYEEPKFVQVGTGLTIDSEVQISDVELRTIGFWIDFFQTRCRDDQERRRVLTALTDFGKLPEGAASRLADYLRERFSPDTTHRRVPLPQSEVGDRCRKTAQNAPVVVNAIATKQIPAPRPTQSTKPEWNAS
jgi:hypothetical protein